MPIIAVENNKRKW